MTGGIVGEYLDLKASADADILAMQLGDFYEFFADDAELVGEELDLKVSEKSSDGSTYPMAGVPVAELTPYLTTLVERGYRVAVADQHETANGHEREVERVVTPGTLLEATDAEARYLAAIVHEGDSGDNTRTGATADGPDGNYGLAFADVTTGKFHATAVEATPEAVLSECYRFSPAEILPGPDVRTDDTLLERLRERTDATLALHASDAFAPGRARHTVEEQFGAEAIESVGLDDTPGAIRAAGGVLSYVAETGVGVLDSMTRIQPYEADSGVALDGTTQRNLELVETMRGGREGSLLDTIDHTTTSAGGRLLREWLTRPKRAIEELTRRQESVAALTGAALARETLRDDLGETYDLERLASTVVSGRTDARDLVRARETLAVLPRVAETIEDDRRLADSPLSAIVADLDREAAAALHDELHDALCEEPPGTIEEGGLFRRGYDEDLDELIDAHEEALDWIEGLAAREKQAHGITHLSTGRNQTDGYYIQVGKSEVDDVPETYEEIKTLKSAKRFSTSNLEERERTILRLEERRGDLEAQLFRDLRERVADRAGLLQDVGRALAELDCLGSLATHAVNHDWTRPELGGEGIDIVAGRHPVVERTTEFVPNDAHLDDDRGFLVVTGPNMSGKSTYLRQVGLITLLAQIGSFVPAERARIDPVDGIYTRVGALDELAQGRSTFMVEMSELANILHSATDESLVILDEVGRGTATYDGISIAWAATEYLHNQVRARTLFATHYHELTALAEHLPRVANVHVAVEEEEDDEDVTFLHTIEDGPTDRSYGVHVADLAGVPAPVVDRSRDVLADLRAERAIEAKGSGSVSGETRQAVFDLGAGEFRTDATATDGATASGGATADSNATANDRMSDRVGDGTPDERGDDTGSESQGFDPETEAVLDEIVAADVNETTPIELLGRVQEWQSRLEDR